MAKVRYVEFTIHLTDRAIVTAQQALYPNGIRVSPQAAAATYSAPIQTYLQQFAAPCVRSPWIWGTTNGPNYPTDVATFTRKTGGWFGISFLFGTTTNYIWVGKFVFGNGTEAEIGGVPTEVVAIAQRRWACGFEIPTDGDMPGGTEARACSRDASRHPDGMGWAFRGDTGAITSTVVRYKPVHTTRSHWDRFYVRVRKAPTAAGRIWICDGGAGNDGIELKLTTGLQFAISNVISGALTLLTSTSQALTLNTWAKIDIVTSYATGGGGAGAYFELWVNGVRWANIDGFPAQGLGSQGAYASSSLGSGATATYEADFDDWIGAETPTRESAAPFRYAGLDWLNGSKVQRLTIDSFGTGHDAVNWSNQSYSNLNQYPDGAVTGMVSTTSGAPIVGLTDAARKVDAQPNALGIVAMIVVVYHTGITAGASTLGWKIAGGVLDLLVLPNQNGAGYQRYMYRPSGLTVPVTPLAPLTLHYLKDLDATSDTVWHLGAVAEVIGTFGAEDVFPGVNAPETIPPRALGAHNNPYPESPWARQHTAPAPYIIHSGTYVGNGLGKDLIFRLPVHWFWLRRVDTANSNVGMWFAANLGASGTFDQVTSQNPTMAFIDPTFVGTGLEDDQEQRTILRITGAASTCNEPGITYQYIAVCDPLGRFLLTGGFGHGGVDGTYTDLLPNAAFTPESGFIQGLTPAGGSTFRAHFKGLGHAADAASALNAAETATFLAWAAGVLTPKDGSTFVSWENNTFALWRRNDGSGDPGIPKTVQLGSYVGDGSASRTIAFGPTGVRPLFVSVTPSNAGSLWRDPSNLGTASKSWATGANNTATGITAGGIDSFTVGSTLNANGIVYSWFVLPGGVTACNGGFSCDGEFIPIEPEPPSELCDDPEATNFGELGVCLYDTPIEETTCTDPLATNFGGLLPCTYDTTPPPPGECPPGTTESSCITETTNLVNLALFEIGVSEMLTNYCTQLTREAVIARTVFNATVRTVLHAYPWPFATKYAVLALATTQPGNADWTYAYRVPEDCVFPRRLVVSRGTAKDPEPPAFMLSSEAGGGLLFTNQAAAVLEYTCRPSCVAVLGDALFLETLKWKLGAVLAPPLTRMDAPAARCQAEYVKCLELANAIKKPGVPGVRTALPLVGDESVACSAANVQVVNRGLLRIGCPTIANLSTDQSPAAVLANLILEDEIRATLRDYPWKFAKRYNAALVTVAGTSAVSANPDWQYTYRLPSDYVMVRRLVTEGLGRSFEENPPPWEVGTDTTGDLLMTAVEDPNLEYTARIPCVVEKGDDLFRDALAWRLAAALAPSLAQVDPEQPEQTGRGPEAPPDPRQRVSQKPIKARMRQDATRFAQAMYQTVLVRARIQDANEAEPEDPPEAEWIRARG